jgi:hypothetical protein
MEMDPPAGDAPAESHYKCNPQAAAWRRITELTYQTFGLLYV